MKMLIWEEQRRWLDESGKTQGTIKMRWLILLLFMSQTLYAGDISTVEPAGLRHKIKDPEKAC